MEEPSPELPASEERVGSEFEGLEPPSSPQAERTMARKRQRESANGLAYFTIPSRRIGFSLNII